MIINKIKSMPAGAKKRKVKCLNTGRVFESVTEAAKQFKLNASQVSAAAIKDQSVRKMFFKFVD